MEIIEKRLEELKPYENNPRQNDNAVESVANSIKEFGFKVPLVIDKNNVIVTGHTRYKACQKLGFEKVPCIIADDLTEEQIKAFRIADNKTSDLADWDDDLLSIELKDIIGNIDMTEFGFGEFELSMHVEDFEPTEYDNDLIEEYSQNSDNFLKAKRIILTYETEEEEEFLKKILQRDKLAVSMKVKDLMNNENL